MLNVVTMPISELTALVELGTAETGLPEAIIEKDLWVCYILDYLFHRSSFANSMILRRHEPFQSLRVDRALLRRR